MKISENNDLRSADNIATGLNAQNVDVNELSKCVGFLRDLARDKLDGALFFEYLDTIIAEGQAVVRSGRTLDYYRAIRDACRQHLMPYKGDPQAMAEVIGWAARLMRYYAVEGQLGRAATPPRGARQQRVPRPAAAGARPTGTVKRFDTNKRFGFITPDGGGEDVFVHISQTPGQQGLQEHQRVSFVLGTGPKGRPQAQDVQPE
jgi:cold shock CspA family protein